MSSHVSKGEYTALDALIAAIVAGDRATAGRWLAGTPSLAHEALGSGATRADAARHFLEPIRHYVYAGDTALHIAAAAYEADLARDLISRGASPRAANRRGAQPLHYAADGGPAAPHWNPAAQAAVVGLLLDVGADPDAEDKSGVTPLHRAVRTRCTAAVRALLDGGADPRKPNRSGSSPLHLAVQSTGRGGSGSAAARVEQEEIVSILLRHGARASDRNLAGRSVWESATADRVRALLGR